MKNHDFISDESTTSYPLRMLADKFVSNLDGVNQAIKSFGMESGTNTRLGVNIDWTKGTIILESNRRHNS